MVKIELQAGEISLFLISTDGYWSKVYYKDPRNQSNIHIGSLALKDIINKLFFALNNPEKLENSGTFKGNSVYWVLPYLKFIQSYIFISLRICLLFFLKMKIIIILKFF
jgi:hypothetical protein